MPECSYIKRAKQIGVEGFWYKEVNEQPILSLMERVVSGEIVYPGSPQPVRMGLALSTEFTEKELEILRLMTGGYSNTEISEKLGISSGVVKNHVADMLFKTKRIGACDTRQNRRRNLIDNAINYIETGSRLPAAVFFCKNFF